MFDFITVEKKSFNHFFNFLFKKTGDHPTQNV